MAQIFCDEPCAGCPQKKNQVKKQSESILIECSKGHQQRFCQFCWTSTPAKLLKKGVHRPRAERIVVRSSCTVKGCRGYYIQAEQYSNGRATTLWSLKNKPERQPENLPYLDRAEELFSEDKLPEVIRLLYREKGTAKCGSAKIITKMKDMKRLGPMQAICRNRLKESWEQLNSNHKLEWIALAKGEREKEASSSSNSRQRKVGESIPRWRRKVSSPTHSFAKQSGARKKSFYDDDQPCPNSVDEITMMKFSRSSASASVPIKLPSPKPPQSKPSLRSANQFPELKVKLRPIFPVIEEKADSVKEEKIENPDWKNWLSATCPDSGDVYYYHKDTNEVTWDKPEKWILKPKKNEPKRPRAPLVIMSDIERRAPALMKSTNLVPEMQRAIIDLEQEKAELERVGRRKDECIQDLTEKLETAEQIKKELGDAKWSLERKIADNLQQMNRTEASLEDMEKQRDANKTVADKRLDEIRYLQSRLKELNDLRNRRHQGVEQDRWNYHQEPHSRKIEHPPPRYYDQRPLLDRDRGAPKPRHNYASQRSGPPEPIGRRSGPKPMVNNSNIERQLEGHMMMNDGPRNQIPQRPMPGHVRQPAEQHWGRHVRGEPFQPRDGPVEGATGNVENFHQNANQAPQPMKREGKSALPPNYQSTEKKWQVREHQQNNFHSNNNFQQQGGERQQSNCYQQQQPPAERRDNPYNEMHKSENRSYNQVPAIQHQDVDVRMNNRHGSFAPDGGGEYQGHERPVMYQSDSREGKPTGPENNPYSNYERQAPRDGKPYAQQKPYRTSYQSGPQNPHTGRHPALQI